MNQDSNLEDRLEALGAAIRGRPSLTDRVMDEVRRSVAADPNPPRPNFRCRQRLFTAAAGTLATISVVLLVAIMLFPSRSVGWADVTKAIRAQKWIRGTVTFPNGKNGAMWLSPERELWAFKLGDSSYFYDGPQQVKYEFHGAGSPVTKLPLGEDEAQRVLSLNALSQDKSAVGHWLFGMEKIVSQERMQVTEAGKTWIEFRMTRFRGDQNQVILRVDPDTRLPVYILFRSPNDAKDSFRWRFDYPGDGPADIYALGVPRGIRIDDRMPSNDALSVLHAMTECRKRIGDFRLLVDESPGSCVGCVVWRKGDRWRVDSFFNLDPAKAGVADQTPQDRDWLDWFEDKLKHSKPVPVFVCDGKTVWENASPSPDEPPAWKVSRRTAPQDLMSGEGRGSLPMAPYVKIASLLFPDLWPQRGWGFDFDPRPADAPGCVLFKRSAELAAKEPRVGHDWYYVDPAKGHAVVRAEFFNLPPNTAGDPPASRMRQKIHMDRFQQTKQGFWYPTVIHDTMPAIQALLPAADNILSPLPPLGKGALEQRTTTVRYHFDFAAAVPDSLFTVDAVPARE